MRRSIIAVVTLIVVAAACGSDGGTTPVPTTPVTPTPGVSKDTIFTLPAAFTPSVLTVAQGAIVTFIFGGGIEHNALFRSTNPAGSPANIQNATNATFARTFGSKGSFTFDCTVHPGMVGTVIVQ